MRKVGLQIEALEARNAPSVVWFTAAESTTECGAPSSAYLETPGNDVGRSGGCSC